MRVAMLSVARVLTVSGLARPLNVDGDQDYQRL